MLCEFETLTPHFTRSAARPLRYDVAVATGETSAHELEAYMQRHVDARVVYVRQSEWAYMRELHGCLHMSMRAALTIAEIYGFIERGLDLKLEAAADLSGLWEERHWPPLQSCEEWVREHAICFQPEPQATFPLPPAEHQRTQDVELIRHEVKNLLALRSSAKRAAS